MQEVNVPPSVRSTCPYCGVGCGVVVDVTAQGVRVVGDKQHPANLGRLCSKGSALAETLDHEGRLLHPLINCLSPPFLINFSITFQKFTDAPISFVKMYELMLKLSSHWRLC